MTDPTNDEELDPQHEAAYERLQEIVAVHEAGDDDRALREAAEFQEQLSGSKDGYLRGCGMTAIVLQGAVLQELGRDDDALIMYDVAAALGAGSDDDDVREERIGALYEKADLLVRMGRNAAAVPVLGGLLTEFWGDRLGSRRDTIIDAQLLLASQAIVALHRYDVAMEGYASIVEEYGDAPDDHARNAVARARVAQAGILAHDGDIAAAGAVYREVLDQLEQEQPGTFDLPHAIALNGCAWVAERDGRSADAAALYRRVLDTFEQDEDASVDAEIRFARDALARIASL